MQENDSHYYSNGHETHQNTHEIFARSFVTISYQFICLILGITNTFWVIILVMKN